MFSAFTYIVIVYMHSETQFCKINCDLYLCLLFISNHLFKRVIIM